MTFSSKFVGVGWDARRLLVRPLRDLSRIGMMLCLVSGLLALVPASPCGVRQAHAQLRRFPRPSPKPTPKPAPKPPAPAFATLLVSVDMDCTLYIDDATQGVALTAWTPKKVPIDQGEHILR